MSAHDAPGGVTIGVDIGGTNIRAARVASDGTLDGHVRVRTEPGPEVAAQIRGLVADLLDARVRAVGIGVPGRIAPDGETILSAGYVRLAGVRLGAEVRDATGLPVVLANDAHMALVAELAIGAAAGARDVALFTVGTGVGGAVAIGGRLHTGRGNAGQLGHLAHAPDGPLCNCGRRGCAEVYASGTALAGRIRAAGLPEGTTVQALLARHTEDAAAADVLRAWAAAWRDTIDTAVAALDPDVVVLGGGLGAEAHAALAAYAPESPSSWFPCPVVAARLGDAAGVIGAGLLAAGR